MHGFDEFFGNLYHLNAEEEPESYYYPKDPEFQKKYGPRGVLHSWANGDGTQKIEDTGPLTTERMETVDEEFHDAAMKFVDAAAKPKKPFFVWYNSTRMHVWTQLKKESEGKTGIGLYPDGMVEHDGMVGQVLKKLDDLGIADNTIVVYSHRQRRGEAHLAGWRHHAVLRREGHHLGRRIPRSAARALARRHQARHGLQRDHLPRGLDADAAGSGRRARHGGEGGRATRSATRPSSSTSTATISCPTSRARRKEPPPRDLLFRPGRQTECGPL